MLGVCRQLQERLCSQGCTSSAANIVCIQIANFAARPAPVASETSDSRSKTLLKFIDPGMPPPDVMSEEDKAAWEARAKEYSRRRMQEHREWQKGLTKRLKLKQAAIAALPTEWLREEAMREDHELFPLNRQIFTDTPPIIVDEKDKKKEKKEAGKVKLGTKRR